MDIHGQTEHLSLMRVREHVDLLDRYGELWPLREQVAALVRELRAVRRELADLRRDERELARRVDLLQYQVGEIEAARLEPGEEEELAQERTRLANAEQLTELADEAYPGPVRGRRGSGIGRGPGAGRGAGAVWAGPPGSVDPALGEAAETVSYQLEDLAESLRDYRDRIEFNPRRLDQVEERLALIHSLQRKYGDSIEDVLAFAERARQKLETIEHSEERIAELEGRGGAPAARDRPGRGRAFSAAAGGGRAAGHRHRGRAGGTEHGPRPLWRGPGLARYRRRGLRRGTAGGL